MERFFQDLKYAIRSLRKTPSFTAAAVLTLALGIGANTGIFTAVNAVVLRPLPYKDPAALVRIWESNPSKGMPRFSVSPPNFLSWKDSSGSFAGMAAYNGASLILTGSGEPERLRGAAVSGDLFTLLGVPPRLGRGFRAEESDPGKEPVAVLSEGLWRRRFGADPSIVGRVLTLDGKPRTVVGVMPASFRFPNARVEVWTPFVFDARALQNRGAKWLAVVARLAPGVPLFRAEAELKAVASALEKTYPEKNTGWGVALLPLHEAIVGSARRNLLLLLGAVALVTLIACANVGSLLLARAASRRREISIRAALGAGRPRLLAQLFVESAVLGVLGAGAGLLVATWLSAGLANLAGDALPRQADVSVDGAVLAFTFALALVSSILFGLVPAWRATRLSGPGVSEGLRGGAAGTGRARARSALVVGELALTLVLLASAGLLLKTMGRLTGVDPGFDTNGAMTFRISLPGSRYDTKEKLAAFYTDLLGRLRGMPGVTSAGAVSFLPLTGDDWSLSVTIPGRTVAAGEEPSAEYRVASVDYFRSMGIPVKRGRAFQEDDRAGAPLVAVVSEKTARRFWPGEDAVGKEMVIGDRTPQPRRVVGVVGDVKPALDEEPEPDVYVPALQKPWSGMSVVVRTGGDPEALVSAARAAVRALDPDLPMDDLGSLAKIAFESVGSRRFTAALLFGFASIALVLALVGVYGVVAYSASQRTREIGVRVALGARRHDILGLFLGEGSRLALAGAILGLVLAFLATRALRSLLFGVSPTDGGTFAAVTVLLGLVALLASWFPAHRATRLDPVEALRCE